MNCPPEAVFRQNSFVYRGEAVSLGGTRSSSHSSSFSRVMDLAQFVSVPTLRTAAAVVVAEGVDERQVAEQPKGEAKNQFREEPTRGVRRQYHPPSPVRRQLEVSTSLGCLKSEYEIMVWLT